MGLGQERSYQNLLDEQFSRYPHTSHNLLESGAFDVATKIMKGQEIPLWLVDFEKKGVLPDGENYFAIQTGVEGVSGGSKYIEREIIKDPFGYYALVERVYYSFEDGYKLLNRVTTVVKQISHGTNKNGYYVFSQAVDEAQGGVPIKIASISCNESYLEDCLLTQEEPIRE